MGTIFISHSSRNNDRALEIRDWLHEHGWRDVFLDLDPSQGLAPGQRWQEELRKAGERCSAVLLLISPEWVASRWCQVEFLLAVQLGKFVLPIKIAPTSDTDLPVELTAHFQYVDLSDPANKDDGFERLSFGLKRGGLDPKDFPWPPAQDPNRSPYRGLRALEEEDAAVFLGREFQITKALDNLRRLRAGAPERLFVILGASGSGKSSFLKAGTLARLQRDLQNFLVLPTMRPERAAMTGRSGLLCSFGLTGTPTVETLKARLDAIRLPVVERLTAQARAVRQSYTSKPPTVVLPIDQAEELFALESRESGAAMDLLNSVLQVDDNLLAIITIRSDSFDRLQGEPRLSAIPRLLFDLPRLSVGAFKEVIEGPGRLAEPEITIEPALTERLLADLDSADALPLLAFTLERLLTDFGQDRELRLNDYEQGLGGVSGAINRAVATAFKLAVADPRLPSDLTDIEALARRAFIPWLLRVDQADTPPTRRVALFSELPFECQPLLQHLVEQRILVSDARDGETTIEVSHEAVLRHWPALASWIEEERDALRTLDSVIAAGLEWRSHSDGDGLGGGDSWLIHRGERLSDAERLLAHADYVGRLSDSREYLDACRAREDTERIAAERRIEAERKQLERQGTLQRRSAGALALVAMLVFGFAVLAVVQSRAASQESSLLLADYALRALNEGEIERAKRLSALAAREGFFLTKPDSSAPRILAAVANRSPNILSLFAHQGVVIGVAESSDERRLLSWGDDGVVRVWDARSGAEIARQTHATRATGALFAPEGKRVLSWGDDGVIKVWDAGSGAEIARQTHEGGVAHALFAADGERVLSWGWDGVVMVWDAGSGAQIVRRKYGGHVGDAHFAGDGQRVLSWGSTWAFSSVITTVWDAGSGAEHARLAQVGRGMFGLGTFGALFAADGERVLSWGSHGVVVVLDAASGAEIARQTHYDDDVRAHSGLIGVRGARFDDDGQRVLSWGWDGLIKVWDAGSGAEIAQQQHDRRGPSALFAPEGKRVLSWGDDGVVKVWDAGSGAEIARQTHEGGVAHALFAADGERVLSWGWDGVVMVWDAGSGAEIARQTHGEGAYGRAGVTGAVFAADGQRVLSWGWDGVVRVWDASSGAEINHQRHSGGARGALFTADGQRVLSWGEDGVVRMWDARFGAEIARHAHASRVTGALFAADGQRVLSWEWDGVVRVWDASSGAEIARQTHGQGSRYGAAVWGAIFSADGRRALSWGQDGVVMVWDAGSGAEIARQTHAGGVAHAFFAADGERVLSWGDGVVKVWDAGSGAEIARQTHAGGVAHALFAADGERVLSWGVDELIKVWDAGSGAEIARQTHGEGAYGKAGVTGAVFAADDQRVLSWGWDGVVRVWDAGSGAEIARQKHIKPFLETDAGVWAQFAADGERVLSYTTLDNIVRVWDAGSGAEIARQTHEGGVAHALFAADGERVLSWGLDHVARVWDARSGIEIARQRHGKGTSEYSAVRGAIFSADGRRALSGGQDGVVMVWDAGSGAEIARQTHEGGVAHALFAADGERVLSWGWDGVVRVWYASSGAEIARQAFKEGSLRAYFSNDDQRVLVWGSDGVLRVWDVSWSVPRASNNELIEEVCRTKLHGNESILDSRFVNGRGETISHRSVRRITREDAAFAPILRTRVGEDVCQPIPFMGHALNLLRKWSHVLG